MMGHAALWPFRWVTQRRLLNRSGKHLHRCSWLACLNGNRRINTLPMPRFNVTTLSSSPCEEPTHRGHSSGFIWVSLYQQSGHAQVNHCKKMSIFCFLTYYFAFLMKKRLNTPGKWNTTAFQVEANKMVSFPLLSQTTQSLNQWMYLFFFVYRSHRLVHIPSLPCRVICRVQSVVMLHCKQI